MRECSGAFGCNSVQHGNVQPEFQRAEAGTDVLGDADDRCSQTTADLTGLGQSLAVGLADDRAGKEGVTGTGGVENVYPFADFCGKTSVRDDLKMPSAALWAFLAEYYLYLPIGKICGFSRLAFSWEGRSEKQHRQQFLQTFTNAEMKAAALGHDPFP